MTSQTLLDKINIIGRLKSMYIMMTTISLLYILGCNTQSTDSVVNNNLFPKDELAVDHIDDKVKQDEEAKRVAEEQVKRAAEERKLVENAELNVMLEHYQTYIKDTDLHKIKTLDFSHAKKRIEEIVQSASHWDYNEPSDDYPKGRCTILAKNARDLAYFANDMTPLIFLHRDNYLNPSILVIPGIIANGKPKIQIQIDDGTVENVNYTNESGLILKLTEKQYDNILNSKHEIKIIIIKDSKTIVIEIVSGNIKECVERIDQRKLDNWEYKEEIIAFDNVTFRFCSSVSPNKVQSRFKPDFDGDKKESPVLIIRQKDHNTPEIILNSKGIYWPSYWNHKIRIKFDDEKPISNSYVNGSGSIAMIFLSSEKAILKKLFSSRRVTFQMPDSIETFSYDLSELPQTCSGLDLSGIVK